MSDLDEFEARTILTFALGAMVVQYDDNSLPRMVDARFTYRDGRTGVVEIFADHSRRWLGYLAFLRDNPTIPAPGLQRRWLIGVLALPRLHSRVQGWIEALGALEATGSSSMAEAPMQVKERLSGAGIGHANARVGQPGVIVLQRQVTAEFFDGETATLLSRYLDWLLKGIAGKKVAKLLDHPDPVDERHLFMWVTESTPMGVGWMLRSGVPDLGSHRAPNLPAGITHLWVASRDPYMRTFGWSVDHGWFDWGYPPRDVQDAVAWEGRSD